MFWSGHGAAPFLLLLLIDAYHLLTNKLFTMNYYKRFLHIAWAMALLLSCQQADTPASRTKSPEDALLWRVSGNGLTVDSYLYGTIHIQAKSVFEYGEPVQKAFQQAQTVAVEVELDKVSPESTLAALVMSDTTLNQLLNNEEFAHVAEMFNSLVKSDLNLMVNIKPFFLYSMMIQAVAPSEMPAPLDVYFVQQGRLQEKKVVGIETFEEQMSMIDRLSYSEQARMLFAAVNDTIPIEKQFQVMLDAYLDMDSRSLMEAVADPSLPREFAKMLVEERNRLMADRIAPLMAEGGVFAAVGAAHLYGPEGVVALLRAKGYSVEPVPFEFGK